MKHRILKTHPLVHLKMLDAKAGTFEALVAVFGNVDLVGDRIVEGAFTKSLDAWKTSGDPIPIIWSHQWDDPFAHIGKAFPADVEQTPDGLLIRKGILDMEKPFATQVYDLMSERRVKEFSFAYDVPDGGEKRAGDGANELLELDLIEAGPTLKGANPATQLVAVKSLKEALDEQLKALEDGLTLTPDQARERINVIPVTAAKAQVQLAGSIEQDLNAVQRAVRSWADDTFATDVWWSYAEATFPDHVVAYVELWDDPEGVGHYYDIPITKADDGSITLGEAAEVQIDGVVTAVAPPPGKSLGRKAGARNSTDDLTRIQTTHDLMIELGANCADTASEGDDTADDPEGDNVKDRKPGVLGILAEVELLEVG